MTRTQDDFEPAHATSSTAHVLAELQLYGHRPFDADFFCDGVDGSQRHRDVPR